MKILACPPLLGFSTSSRVCITVSNSPNPSRVYIGLCKHGKRLLLLKQWSVCKTRNLPGTYRNLPEATGTCRNLHKVVLRLPESWSNWNLEKLVFEERGKLEYPEKNLSQQRREPTTNSTHILWHQCRDLNLGHIAGRRVLPPLFHPLLLKWSFSLEGHSTNMSVDTPLRHKIHKV